MIDNPIERLKQILPLATEWAQTQESLILSQGYPLVPQLINEAIRIGVQYPQKVKVLLIPQIPIPEHPILKIACQETNLITTKTGGLTLRYGIFIRSDCANDRRLYRHELKHVSQYEKLGGINQFLERYLFEVATTGYLHNPMEQEAIKAENIDLI